MIDHLLWALPRHYRRLVNMHNPCSLVEFRHQPGGRNSKETEVPLSRIGMDLVGLLPKSARGHEHILVILDYAAWYPKAVPLRKATAKAITREFFLLFRQVGIPQEILTD